MGTAGIPPREVLAEQYVMMCHRSISITKNIAVLLLLASTAVLLSS